MADFLSELAHCIHVVASVFWIVRKKTPGKFIIMSLFDLTLSDALNTNDGVCFIFLSVS